MNEQVSLSKLQDWLRRSISSELSQAEREREKMLSEIARAQDSLNQTCNQLSKKAERDMEEKRENRAEYRAAKAVDRLTSIISGMCKSVSTMSANDTTSLRTLQRQLSKLASDAAGERQEWLRQIRPFYIIDMMTLGGNIDKVKRLGEELHSFLVGRGSLLRSVEELNEKMDTIFKLEGSRKTFKSQSQSLEARLQESVQTERELRAQADRIRDSTEIKEYSQIGSELRSLRSELLRTGFSRLGRPLRKLISVSERGDYPLPTDIREDLKEYAKKPFTTFLTEEDGYPRLKRVLTALSNAVSSGKVALKQREAKKVIERTKQAVEAESLTTLHTKSRDLKRNYDQLLADPQTAALVQQLKDLRLKARANHKTESDLRDELSRVQENESRLEDQINAQLRNTEEFVAKLTGTAPNLRLA